MKKEAVDAICPNCEWSGDATGITSCPVCGSNLSLLDAHDDFEQVADEAKYPKEFLSRRDVGSDLLD
ncbi:MAG TPA: hypothetical protein VJK26_02845 [Patescibacteria group bacterium]|nr:hypothetical protein [Patescibacteria group bacterium]